MKTKKLSKKMTLNKKTIADLNINAMEKILGGKDQTTVPDPVTFGAQTCNSCDISMCCTVTGDPCKAC